ncbi:MAG: tetratricopeptide repeat protein [Planctomycetaceae bacterium]|nr:tetratricopeptide repeat protein [Planctomycetaceae bacterium]
MCTPLLPPVTRYATGLSSCLLLLLTPLAGVTQENQSAAIRDYNVAAALQNAGLYPRAAERWTNFLKTHPKDTRLDRATYYLGVCQLHTKQYPQSTATFQGLIAKYPKFPDLDGAYYNIAMCAYQLAVTSKNTADYQKAIAAFQAMVTKYPKSSYAPRAIYFQAESHYVGKQLKEAVAAYQKIITSYPSSPLLPDTLYAMGTTQQELTLHAEAEATFAQFLAKADFAKHPLFPEVNLRAALCQFSQKKFAEADKRLAIVVTLKDFPLVDLAYLRQGQCRVELGNYDQAVPLLVKFIAEFPKSPHAPAGTLALGRSYYQLEKLDDARRVLEPLAKLKVAESPEAAYWLGRGLLKQKKPTEAFALLDAIAKTSGDSAYLPYLQLTRVDAIYEIAARRKETPALYEAFVKQHPKHALTPQAHYMSAFASLGEKDYVVSRSRAETFLTNPEYAKHELTPAVLFIAGEGYLLHPDEANQATHRVKAEALYRRVVAEYPEHPRVSAANLRISWCLYQGKKYTESAALLKTILPALTEPAQKADAHFLLGRNSTGLNKDQEAISFFDQSLASDPQWSRRDEVLLASGGSYRRLKNTAAAIGRFTELTSKYPDSSYRAQALFELGELAQQEAKHDVAIGHFNETVAKYKATPFGPLALYGLGSSYYAKEDLPNALTQLNALLAATPAAPLINQARYLRGLTHQRLNQFPPAIADFQVYIAAKPMGEALWDAKYALALCHVGAKQLDPAIATLKELQTGQPKYKFADKVLYELAHAQLGKTLPADAATTFRQLAETHKESPLAAESWFHVGQHQASVAADAKDAAPKTAALTSSDQAFTAAIASKPTPELHEKLLYRLADVRFQASNYPGAGQLLAAQITMFPNGELIDPARFLAAECYFQQDDFTKALPLYTMVASRKVERYHAQALYRAGTCAANLKQWDPSRTHFASLLTTFPKFEQAHEARYGQAWAHQQLKQFPQARTLYELITRETETITAAKARFMVGELDFGDAKYESAIEHFLAVAVGYPFPEWKALGHFEAARCFIQLKQNAKAIASLEIITKDHAQHPKAKDAAKLLAELKK